MEMVFYGGETYYLAEFFIQRGLALTYFFAFLVIYRQYIPLVGENGILPVNQFVKEKSFKEFPSIFFIANNDKFLRFAAIIGLITSFLAITGLSESFGPAFSVLIWTMLWVLIFSFRNTGQRFFSQGVLLIESGLLTIFLGSLGTASSEIVIWLFRWLLFRLMFNSGLGKIRGDKAWRDLSAFQFNLETQPFPGPLSWRLYHLPKLLHKSLTAFGLFCMLIVPWFYFAPQPLASIAGLLTIIYQIGIKLSGNYSWLNIATISIAFSTFSDQVINTVLGFNLPPSGLQPYPFELQAFGLAVIIFGVSIDPIADMFKSNVSEVYYGVIPIINTYEKFPEIDKERIEVVIQGTRDEINEEDWEDYRCQVNPPRLEQRPKQYAPYYHRLDYQLSKVSNNEDCKEEWFQKMMQQVLRNNQDLLKLFSHNPFPEKGPKYVRAVKYKYSFSDTEEMQESGVFWTRQKKKVIHKPISLN